VPLTFDEKLLERTKPLSGLAVDAIVSCRTGRFREGLLFTHRGLSGPSVLQVSSYWREGDEISVDLLPEGDVFAFLKDAKNLHPKQQLRSVLSEAMPARLAALVEDLSECHLKVAELSDKNIRNVADIVKNMKILPSGTEGYRTAEVTLGGVDTTRISSKTFESSSVKGLYFVGEVLDVTGHLGGHNFQWAWASGWSAGQFV
jgi:predicted Rossmann fold flavoprotein